ncbi:hypothetical protein AB0L33_34475 [Streptomyces sp. NPDC052299]|uniref:hypothetical protein n=1 Tax=Streptomyces sp. NPDC052299 TaxID=3155054 RepID=UPI00343CB5DD
MTSAADGSTTGPALEQLRYRLHRLHRENGEPSYRVIARRTGRAVAHETARVVLRCESPPRWGPLELLVEALGGDVDEFRALWIAMRDEVSPLALPTAAEQDEPEEPSPVAQLSIPELADAEADLQDRVAEHSRREGETRTDLLAALEARADLSDRLAVLHEELGRERGRSEELRRRVDELEAELAVCARRVVWLQDELRALRDERLGLLKQLNGLHIRRAELYFTWAREEERRRRAAEAGREVAGQERDREVADLRVRLAGAESLLRSLAASRSQEDQFLAGRDDTG